MKKVVIVGGGAAGAIAALNAAKNGREVHIYEKNNRIGKKILITGKGRCNITNASDVEDILQNIPQNPYFLYSSLYSFDSFAVIDFFKELGLETKVERGNRVFPVSDKASDVVAALEKALKKHGVKIHFESPVKSVVSENGSVTGIKLKNGSFVNSESVLIATGGISYPSTGSTGDGYNMAKELNHTVTKLYPSLVPLVCHEKWCSELMGLSLKNISIKVYNKEGKQVYDDFGEMLFTHYGVSGPVILSASSRIRGNADGYVISIDLKPALDLKALDNRILRDFNKYINKAFKNSLDELLPQKIIPVIVGLSNIQPDKKVNSITKEERKRLAELIKAFKVTVKSPSGYNEAVVTSGGVSVDEINPSTMESKIVKGLFFAGEVIDVDGYTGGFNLQIAWSTGYIAGINI